MRELDEEVRDVLFSLNPTQTMTINAKEQRLIARWAVKTMLVFMTKEPPVRQQEYGVHSIYKIFGSEHEPLPGMQLWVGAHREDIPGWFRPHSATWHTPDGEEKAGFGAVLTLAHVVLLLLANIPPRWKAHLRYEPAIALKQISPLSAPTLQWPPRLLFAKNDLTELVESFQNISLLSQPISEASSSCRKSDT